MYLFSMTYRNIVMAHFSEGGWPDYKCKIKCITHFHDEFSSENLHIWKSVAEIAISLLIIHYPLLLGLRTWIQGYDVFPNLLCT